MKNSKVLGNGEVLTPHWMVTQMCNLITPLMTDSYEMTIYKLNQTILEPCCGDGRILLNLLERKIMIYDYPVQFNNDLYNGYMTYGEYEAKILMILYRLYGIDIDLSNVKVTRHALMRRVLELTREGLGKNPSLKFIKFAKDIIDHNIMWGDALNDDFSVIRWELSTKNLDNGCCVLVKFPMMMSEVPDVFKEYGINLFDVIITNPPYQINMIKSSSRNYLSLYDQFVEFAWKLKPQQIIMIIPARWMGVSPSKAKFRKKMLTSHLKDLVIYEDSAQVFGDDVIIKGGICYFNWLFERSTVTRIEKHYQSFYVTQCNKRLSSEDMVPYIIERWGLYDRLRCKGNNNMAINYKRNPFGLPTNAKGDKHGDLILLTSSKILTVNRSSIKRGSEYIDKWKVIIPRVVDTRSLNTKYRVIYPTLGILGPGEVCTDSYVILDCSEDIEYIYGIYNYVRSSIFRFILLQSCSNFHITDRNFRSIKALPERVVRSLAYSDDIDRFLSLYFELPPCDIIHIKKLIRDVW